ncbi:hypothetical protein B4N89_30635 [Embleya scabrispora]|uniref:Uncharacterized protein n=1 Tax=Embleya scabrispora TaxID=159449 RepID=A0A1T3P6H5_9ACTN|nr:hypothetical protein B4N89_30635 [Embleya scabrispora]
MLVEFGIFFGPVGHVGGVAACGEGAFGGSGDRCPVAPVVVAHAEVVRAPGRERVGVGGLVGSGGVRILLHEGLHAIGVGAFEQVVRPGQRRQQYRAQALDPVQEQDAFVGIGDQRRIQLRRPQTRLDPSSRPRSALGWRRCARG